MIDPFTKLYRDLFFKGRPMEARGQKALELENYSLTIEPYQYMTSFDARKFNLNYCKAEWAWYLRGDPYDRSIEKHASLWKKIRTADGGFNSNYGQYIFGENQIDWVVSTLVNDVDSRQASMQFLNKSHLYYGNPDVVCTHGLNFRIRDNKLQMTVMMRSNDAIFGLTNDVFCFGHLHMYVLHAIKALGGARFLDLELGDYTHFVCSMHVYERHYDMLAKLVSNLGADYREIDWPRPEKLYDFTCVKTGRPETAYSKWILEYENQ